MPDWLEFELLAEKIYRELQVVPGAVVTHDDRLWGHESLEYRQIDVSVRWTDEDGIRRLLIVQARDRNSPADVNAVGELTGVISDVRADRAILVCRSGFTIGARNQATSHGIQLHNLHDAQSMKWSHELKIPILWIDKSPCVNFSFQAGLDRGDRTRPVDVYVVAESGARHRYLDIFRKLWDGGVLSREPRFHPIDLRNAMEIRVFRADGVPVWRPTREFTASYRVTQRAWIGYFTPKICRGIIDHLNEGAFLASHLPLGQIPIERGPEWAEVDDPDSIAVRLRGTFATSENISVEWNASEGNGRLSYQGPLPPDHRF